MTAQTAGFCGCRTGADGIWPGDAIDIVDIAIDTLWLFNVAMENPFYMDVFLGKSSVSLPFSIAMFFNFQMVIYIDDYDFGDAYQTSEHTQQSDAKRLRVCVRTGYQVPHKWMVLHF